MNISLKGFLNFTVGIDIVQIGIETHFDQHTRIVAGGTNAFILFDNMIDIQLVDHLIYEPYGMMLWDPIENIFNKNLGTVGRKGFETHV